MPEMESVTALRTRLAMVSNESVSKMREFGSIADLDIFAVGSRKERMRLDGATNSDLDNVTILDISTH